MTAEPNAQSDHLTGQQWATLRALVDRVIPRDEWPSGWDAGVGSYLAGQFDRDLRSKVSLYRRGLNSLDAEAHATAGRRFADLTAEQQDALLTDIEQAKVKAVWTTPPAKFFAMAVHHANEGFYADPGNGGNFDEVSWKMIGFRPASGTAR